jgi:hypothetical protein
MNKLKWATWPTLEEGINNFLYNYGREYFPIDMLIRNDQVKAGGVAQAIRAPPWVQTPVPHTCTQKCSGEKIQAIPLIKQKASIISMLFKNCMYITCEL